MTLGIDEIRTPQVEVEPPEEYFSKMAISKEQKEERVEAAEDLQDDILFLFNLLLVEAMYGEDYELVYSTFLTRFRNTVAKFARMDDYIKSYIAERPREIFETTLKRMELGGWWTSVDRATIIGENEANSVCNYEDLQEAIDAGYTKKMWLSERDARVRRSHMAVDGVTIPIQEYFIVGDAAMMMPHDPECLDARETVNCRCSLKYLNKDDDIDDGTSESEDGNRRKFRNTIVNREVLNARTMDTIFSVLGEDSETTAEISNRTMEILRHRTGTRWEDLAYVNPVNHESMINKDFNWYSRKKKTSMCQPSKDMKKMLADADERTIISIHNHPFNSAPSFADIQAAYKRKYKYGLVIGHKGNIYKYAVRDDAVLNKLSQITIDNRLANLEKAIYNNDTKMKEKCIKVLSEYGIDIEVIL